MSTPFPFCPLYDVPITPGFWEPKGYAVYSAPNWWEGRNDGGFYIAQCFDTDSHEVYPELLIDDRGRHCRVPETEAEASANARVIALTPRMLRVVAALESSNHPLASEAAAIMATARVRRIGRPIEKKAHVMAVAPA